MNADDQLKAYREAMGLEGYTAALAREGRTPDGTCGTCGTELPTGHKTTCAYHPMNRQRRAVASK